MIPWWVAVVALIVGEFFGVATIRFCSMNEPEKHNKYIK